MDYPCNKNVFLYRKEPIVRVILFKKMQLNS